jgi:hypothetical protein
MPSENPARISSIGMVPPVQRLTTAANLVQMPGETRSLGQVPERLPESDYGYSRGLHAKKQLHLAGWLQELSISA